MSDTADTSADAVEAARLAIAGGRAWSKEVALLGALLRERDEARADAARYLADANKGAATLLRPDVAAILRGEAVAVPIASGQSVGEPRGCPTPGACSCVGAQKESGNE